MPTVFKTGLCSYGMSGKLFHAPFLAVHPGFDLNVIVERTKNESRQRYPHSKLYRFVEELVADENIELIVVNTPVQTHYKFAKAALLAGKHVVVEKPFVIHSKEGEELAELAQKKKLVLTVYQNRRYDGDYNAVKDIIGQNVLGELREVEMRFDRYRPHFSGKQHKEGNLPGAGTLYDLGAHLVDQALQLFGWPEKIFADVWKMRDDVEADDYFELLLYYGQLRVRLKATSIARESYAGYVLHGMQGSFLQQRSDMQEQLLNEGVMPSLHGWSKTPAEPDGILHTEINGKLVRQQLTSTPGNYMCFYDDLYKALTGEAANPVPATDGVNIIRLIEAAKSSAEEGRIINL
jgi:scyllo-inositol 2-dehydrogenase (NADP+)